ncbi:hypothetical protein Q5752_000683 [Cryptotrichosporon argae]
MPSDDRYTRDDRDRRDERKAERSRDRHPNETGSGSRARRDEHRHDRDADRGSRRAGERERERDDRVGDRRDRHRHDHAHRSKHRSRSPRRPRRSSSPEVLDLRTLGAAPISDADFSLKSAEFKYWLCTERDKHLAELSPPDAHKYFRRFVRRWNDGALQRACYAPPAAPPAVQTGNKGSFSDVYERDTTRDSHGRRSSSPRRRAAGVIESDDELAGPMPPSPSPEPGPVPDVPVGPSRPAPADRQYGRESLSELRASERKAARRAAYERADAAVPRLGGREGKLAERHAVNAANRERRERDGAGAAAGLEVDDRTLMGDADGFGAALALREREEGRASERQMEREEARRLRADEARKERAQKETATMDMLKAIAAQRYG